MKKNLPYFLVIVALVFLIIGVLSSGKRQPRTEQASLFNQPINRPSAPEMTFAKVTQESANRTHLEKAIFGFEHNSPFWEIPDWCLEKDDYVGKNIALSGKFAAEGKCSLELSVDFSGTRWTAAYLEVQEYFDWTPYQSLSADIFLPEDAPFGLKAKIILTVGKDWKWTEMSRLVKLIPGEWTTVSAGISPGSTDWRRTEVTDEFRADVRKLGLRVESNMRPVYAGPIYIDNVRLE